MTKINDEIRNGQFNLAVFFKHNLLILIGFLALAIPSVFSLSQGLWQSDDQAHGPIILACHLVILADKRQVSRNDSKSTA
ncbi:hypothetical protein [Deefgea sp. CFH1-16]|uniref:hypothetical protein n=1 Tax=Deefgea sp. CFH1-16 TaxID=2675457 RepID=UPI0015F655E4|nr:hypothetical protein [Deefgea sp. CFH1-16]MBM5574870.1 hypothetical protein [Deefgea sp. CFH1-16]